MNESKQITIENWQFSAVDSIQEFFLFIFDYYHVFWRGEGVIPYIVSTDWYSRNLGLNTMQSDAWIFSPLTVWRVQLNKMAGW